MKRYHLFYFAIVLGVTKHAWSDRGHYFCIGSTIRRTITIFYEAFFQNSRILEFCDPKLPDPGVFDSKTPGSGSFRSQNSPIREFSIAKLQDPGVLKKCFTKNDDCTSYRAICTKTTSTTGSSMLCYPQIDSKKEKMLSFDCSEEVFRTQTKTPGSGSFEIENSWIREF